MIWNKYKYAIPPRKLLHKTTTMYQLQTKCLMQQKIDKAEAFLVFKRMGKLTDSLPLETQGKQNKIAEHGVRNSDAW